MKPQSKSRKENLPDIIIVCPRCKETKIIMYMTVLGWKVLQQFTHEEDDTRRCNNCAFKISNSSIFTEIGEKCPQNLDITF